MKSAVTMNRLPSLFVSHGAPTFAIEPGLAGPKLTSLGQSLPRPRAVTEHFWPLLVATSAAASPLPATVIEGGITHGVLAMDAFVFGAVGPLDIDAT
jgi:aromatic ring-opening dioxygenase catalytic subunit (LigB family)